MNGLDIAIIVIMVLALLRGLLRGAAKELYDVIRIPGALVCGSLFYMVVGKFLGGFTFVRKITDWLIYNRLVQFFINLFNNQTESNLDQQEVVTWVIYGISFIVVTVIALFLLSWLLGFLPEAMDKLKLGALDKVLGVVLGGFVGSLICCLLVFAFQSHPDPQYMNLLEESLIGPAVNWYYQGVVNIFSKLVIR